MTNYGEDHEDGDDEEELSQAEGEHGSLVDDDEDDDDMDDEDEEEDKEEEEEEPGKKKLKVNWIEAQFMNKYLGESLRNVFNEKDSEEEVRSCFPGPDSHHQDTDWHIILHSLKKNTKYFLSSFNNQHEVQVEGQEGRMAS